ncbi:cell division initiation protein [Melghirimyces profundicolus]|uniref:Cell division initiation protein n=1 Tax=Melghirimyces profundicolus TaxID=1242148 RepID=A0A2T6B7C0_9BACL|nr:cell division initiation protein [Melghirimyces profundicolus]
MPLSPLDIHNKEFKRSFRGYDVDEVNDFLDQIIKDFEFLIREKQQLEQQVEELQQELEQALEEQMVTPSQDTQAPAPQPPQPQPQPRYQQPEPPAPIQQQQPSASSLSSMEQSIHKSIRVAQEVAEEVRLNAKKEAELIVQEAEKNADRIINEALQKAREVHTELLDLKQKATVYRARFRTLVQSHLDILENSDWESLEELEEGLDEVGKQLDQYAEGRSDNLALQQPEDYGQSQEYSQEGYGHSPLENTNPSYDQGSYMDEGDEPRREMRRTSRKMKRKAMF